MTLGSTRPPFISALPPTGNIPKLSDYARSGGTIAIPPELQAALDERPSAEDIAAGRTGPNFIFERLKAESEKRELEKNRLVTMITARMSIIKKQSAELSKKAAIESIARLEKLLATPPEEPQTLTKEQGEKMREFFEERLRKEGGASPFGNPNYDKVSFYSEDGWIYSFHKNGKVTRQKQGVLTPQEVPSYRRELYQLRLDLGTGVYDARIAEYQKQIDANLEKLGKLTEQEQKFLYGADAKPRGNVSIEA